MLLMVKQVLLFVRRRRTMTMIMEEWGGEKEDISYNEQQQTDWEN
jgi:hypothetical protein